MSEGKDVNYLRYYPLGHLLNVVGCERHTFSTRMAPEQLQTWQPSLVVRSCHAVAPQVSGGSTIIGIYLEVLPSMFLWESSKQPFVLLVNW